MTEDDREKFARLFFGLEEYHGRRHSKIVIEMYFKCLRDLSFEQLENAIQAWAGFYNLLKTYGAAILQNETIHDPVMLQVIRMLGGADRNRKWTEAEIPFRQKNFIEYYSLIKGTGFRNRRH